MLINEQGFFSHINLSIARYHQFNTILCFLPLDDIQSLAIDSDASPLQLTRWPYLPRLRTPRIIGAYNYDDLLLFLLLHAATLTHLIIKSNKRLISHGSSIKFNYPTGDMVMLLNNILLIHLSALRSLDLGMKYYRTCWPITTAVVPLTYLRLSLLNMDILIRLMSTPPLFQTLRQLHLQIGDSDFNSHFSVSMFHLSIRMINLHTFTFVQTFFSMLTIEWTVFEMLTSSKIMPVLRHANVSIFININDLNRIGSSSLFTDHRHVDIHFVFNLINFGATLLVNNWSDRSEWLTDGDPFSRGRQYYHNMWYTLPWAFDEFFHEYVPYKWITKVQVFEQPSQKIMTIDQSSLRTLDASGSTLASSIYSLPHVVLFDCIKTFHLSFWNTPVPIELSTLCNITLVNSIGFLNDLSFPTNVRSIRILLFYNYPNYMLPNWSMVLHTLSTWPQLRSLRVFMYDLPETVDDKNCEIIAKIASLVSDFGFCFRHKFGLADADELKTVFKNHKKFIKQLGDCILLSFDKQQPYYSIEKDECGLIMWF
ncbi:unnamed protein product [Rotaria sp. Silwood2]|nr:unnamed protein product [Rotaria sp. Silwood2]CAF4509296.1 unnamed protein product [Rotaria sp. Silwood2]